MFQTDQPTAATVLPTPAAAGTPGYFTNGNPATGVAATILDADFVNMLMLELMNVVSAGGLTPSKTTYTQVRDAIKRIVQNTVVLADTGAVNAYTAVNATPLVAGTWVDGVVQAVKIAHTNTGASTYAPDGLTAIPIYGLGLQPLQGGELLLNGTAILMHMTIAGVNSGNPIAVLMECAGGAQQVAPATASQHAVQLGQLPTLGGAAFAVTNTSLNVTLSNGVASTLQTLNVTLPNVGSTGKYRLIVTSQAKFNQTVSSPTFQNIQTLINDGTTTASGAGWLFAGASSTTAVYGVGDTVLLGPYTPGATITLTQQGFQNGSAWNAHVTAAQLFVQAVLSSN